ncbi:MAG: hypothetical protein IPH20_08605 [Bacteroidales bacterium]|nr:hypothetical protein [Bacteroidales bacterium]
MNIRLIRHTELDKTAWDNCIDKAVNGNIYGFSWYLDIVCDEWDALVAGDYETVFLLPTGRSSDFGIFFSQISPSNWVYSQSAISHLTLSTHFYPPSRGNTGLLKST